MFLSPLTKISNNNNSTNFLLYYEWIKYYKITKPGRHNGPINISLS